MKSCWALLAAAIICLSGCFLFDNPYDGPMPSASFQIVVSSPAYGGTYVWNSTDGAFEATVGVTRYFVFLSTDAISGAWCLSDSLAKGPITGQDIAHTVANYAALPPVDGNTAWSPNTALTAINDNTGGVSGPAGPDSPVTYGSTLHVTFSSTASFGLATYQWERSSATDFNSRELVGTDSTHNTSSDSGHWLRVIVTPWDSTGTVKGTPAISPPVRVNGP